MILIRYIGTRLILAGADKLARNLSFAGILIFCYSVGMDHEMLSFMQHARQLGIGLNEYQLGQFDIYRKELLTWNAKTNLVSGKSAQEIVHRHFLDSLTALQYITKNYARVIDVGCGAGFPGIPLKIAAPALQLYLLETNRKKVSFLKHIVRLLNLVDTFVLHERAEHLQNTDHWQGYFDILISRAAFKLPDLLFFGAFFLKPAGKIIALKAQDMEAEFLQATQAAPDHGFNQLIPYDINYDFLEFPRKIIIGEKTN